MATREPIKAMFDGVWLNTSNDKEVHAVEQEYFDANASPRPVTMTQALYRTAEDKFFLAFWNRLVWDKVELRNKFVDTAELINSQQAQHWLEQHGAAHKVAEMDARPDEGPTRAITVRLPEALLQRIELSAKAGRVSVNKVSSNLLLWAMSMQDREPLYAPPTWTRLCMPDGRPAHDEHGRANSFEAKDLQKLADCGTILLQLAKQGRHDKIWSFVVRTLNRLIFIDKNQTHVLCFAQWVSMCRRGTLQDIREAEGVEEWQPG